MTPRERLDAVFTGRPPDHAPVGVGRAIAIAELLERHGVRGQQMPRDVDQRDRVLARGTVEIVAPESLPELKRETLNPWLEAWYNADLEGLEKPVYVPYHHLFGPRDFAKLDFGPLVYVAGILGLGALIAHSGWGEHLGAAIAQLPTLGLERPLGNFATLVATGIGTGLISTLPGVTSSSW